MDKLKNKVTVITSGNSGIGFGIAEAFKNEGATGATQFPYLRSFCFVRLKLKRLVAI